MKNRSLPYYLRWMHKENPPKDIKKTLIFRFKKGGLKYLLGDDAKKLEGVSLEQIYYTNPLTNEYYAWVYVGDSWWCRKRESPSRYEFGRLVAVFNKKSNTVTEVFEIEGLWDVRRHEHKVEPVIIYRGDIKGYIVGFNEYEILVDWEIDGSRSPTTPVSDVDGISFEFNEDLKKYSKLFDTIRKRRKITNKI